MDTAVTLTGGARVGGAWRRFKRYIPGALFAAGAIVLGVLAGPRVLFGPQVAVRSVVQRDFVQSVVASGHVEAPHRVNVGAQVTGTVKRIPVAEGQLVQAGQVLVELDPEEANAAVRQADVAVSQAQARLRQVLELQTPVARQSVRQAQIALDNARAQLRRQTDLFNQGFIGAAALEDSRKAVDLSESQERSAQAQLASVLPTGSDHAVALAALAQARASADEVRSRLRHLTVVATTGGTLIRRDVEPGEVVQPGKVLMTLSPSGETQLVVQIDEKNLHLLKIGQAADASADAFADQRFAAQLVFINPGVDAQRGSVEVKLAVPQPPAYLTQDMTVYVDIRVARREQAVLVPADAVQDVDGAAPWVLKVDGHHARRQAVRLGLRGGGLCEVSSGLRAGDQVVPATSDLRDGARLRPVPVGPAPR